jgi:hypothetical protein
MTSEKFTYKGMQCYCRRKKANFKMLKNLLSKLIL